MERRLAAILAADVAGYSRLMGADEAGTLAALRQLRNELFEPVVAEHRGDIVKRMGDGWLVEFASVVDAVSCAIKVQEGLVDHEIIKLRMGIHIGDIVHEDEDIYGDGVNIAARLQDIVVPGGLAVSGVVHQQIAGKTAVRFQSGGAHMLKNISEPIQVWVWSHIHPADANAVTEGVVAGPASGQAERPCIAVLPFDNMSNDPEQDYFADGLTEDLIMTLAQFQGLRVIARNSTFVYKGTATNIIKIARELNVSHVLQGSVRRAGQRIRVTAQLIAAEDGTHVWGERYDRPLHNVFAVQDEINLSIASALGQQLSEEQSVASSRRGTDNLEAWRAIVQSMEAFRDSSKSGFARARSLSEKAVELDPDYAFGWGHLALITVTNVRYGYSKTPDDDLRKVFEYTERALSLDPNLPEAYCARGFSLVFKGNCDAGIPELRHAVELAPGDSRAIFFLGAVLNFCGGEEEAVHLLREAQRLDPHHGPWVLGALGHSLRLSGRYEEALEVIAQHQAIRPASAHDDLVICLSEMGREADAKSATRTLLHFHPDFSVEGYAKRQYYKDPQRLEKDLKALRGAGLD